MSVEAPEEVGVARAPSDQDDEQDERAEIVRVLPHGPQHRGEVAVVLAQHPGCQQCATASAPNHTARRARVRAG